MSDIFKRSYTESTVVI